MTNRGGVQAWVTTALDDKSVAKAIVLAGSLRRVRTAKKLAIFTTLAVSNKLKKKLKEVFDLVLLLEHEVSNGLSLDNYAKIQGFSLQVFKKCVFLSPNTLVLKNCDEIFDKYAVFAACRNGEGEEEEVDTNVYVFSPSQEQSRALDKFPHSLDIADGRIRGSFSKYFSLWMQNNIPNSETLETKYNMPMDLEDGSNGCMELLDASIVNFVSSIPLEMGEDKLRIKLEGLDITERFVVERFLQIYTEDVKQNISVAHGNILEHFENEPIAVVGMSFRLPGGNNVDEFWDLLANGREAIRPVPPFRWTKEHTTIACKNRQFEAGFLTVPVDEFDAKFFGLSPKEAIFLDPQQRLLHEVSWEAMEDAMIDPHKLHGTQTGVFVGSWIYDYKDIALRSSDVDFFRVYMGTSLASEAARLSHFYGTTGPSIATESGCSSAIVALHMACNSLRRHESNMALACGVNLLLLPLDMTTMSFVVAPDGRCKTFDADANGFGRAEGCAVLLLKRYSDAIRDENKIWGLIRGTAVTQEGVSKSLGTPTVQCESMAMEHALKDAGVDPLEVDYIEAHGTGTSVGDPMEVAAITKAYSKNGRREPLVIGSVKTNVGHTESVSGLTGVIKVLLSMKHEMIPPHLNLKTINPEINLNAIPAEIPLSAMPWPRYEKRPRLAGVSSFGISGTDGHAIVQEGPEIRKENVNFHLERPLHIMKISAKCQESLDELLRKYEGIFSEQAERDSGLDFANFAYSANVGRSTFNHRVVLIAKDFTQAAKIIRNKSYKHADVQSTGSQLCFLFTGQGSQYPNMAKNLYSTSPIFKYQFDKCSDILQKRYGISIKDVLWGDSREGDELSRTLYSQTSIFCVEYCLLKLWESWGVKPDFVMGHSLGEFAAAVAAGALSFEDALMLVAERSRLIDNLPRGKMLVIKADKSTVDSTIAKYKESNPDFCVDYAALNSPHQTVVAGDSIQIEIFARFCEGKKLKSIVLASTHAFHSRHMDPMLEAYRKAAMTVKRPTGVKDSTPKYISGMEGSLIGIDSINADYWVRHTREKVNFIDACKVMEKEICNLFLEVGPHPVLSALTMMNIEGHSVTCLPSLRRKEDDWATLMDSLSKLFLSEWKGEIDWKGFDLCYQRQAVTIPFYQFNRKPIWTTTRPAIKDLHALVGKVIPNASGLSVFEQDLTIKKAEFVQDHVIGNTVVFPGAGYLEMCLVGGHSCVQGFGDTFQHPRRPVLLKDLKIKAPLALQDSQLCVLQTVVGLDESDKEEMGYTVNISRLNLSDSAAGGQWISHASAKFLPVVPTLPLEMCEFNLAEAQESWEKVDNNDFYEKLPEVGLRFGPRFQSLQGGWRNEKGILLEVKIPTDTEAYVIHPVVADAMIQAAMLWTSKDKLKRKLQVPVHVGEFILLASSSNNTNLYVFCSTKGNGSIYSLLVNDQGTPVAYMSDIDFAETTVKLIEGMIHDQGASMPQLWEEFWKPQMGPTERRLVFKKMEPPSTEMMNNFIDGNKLEDPELEHYATLCSRATLYFLQALYKLGWNPQLGKSFTTDELFKSFQIQENFFNWGSFFMKTASDSGYLSMLSDGKTFTPTEGLPTSLEITDELSTPVKPYVSERIEFKLITKIGSHLSEILIGEDDVLKYLFPTDPSKPHAQELYAVLGNYGFQRVQKVNSSYVFPRVLEWEEETMKRRTTGEKSVIRILEVGAGTGSVSKEFIEEFHKRGLEIEYYFTDISAAFFPSAEKRLKEHLKSVVFKKFNMEEDPFKQGYIPQYFDYIYAFEVLHVSKEIRPVLESLRLLLKPNGFIEIYETAISCIRETFIFGLLEGYWQFKDHDLRPSHITMSAEKWEKTLKDTGFTSILSVPVYNGVHSFVFAQALDPQLERPICKEIVGPEEYSWLILSDGSELADALGDKLGLLNRKVKTILQPNGLTEDTTNEMVKDWIDAASQGVNQLEGVIYLWGMSNQPGNRDQTKISLPLITLCQHLLTLENQPRVCVFTQGVHSINGSDVMDPNPGTLVGIVRAMRNEYIAFRIFRIDLSPDEPALHQVNEAFYNLWAESDGEIGLRGGKHVVPKYRLLKRPNENLSLPNGCDRFQLTLPETRMISDLEFIYLEPYSLGEKEIEVKVNTMALNFRDVFAVLKPLPIFEELNTVGLDFAGVVIRVGKEVFKVKIGDRVVGMNTTENCSLPSHVKIDEHLVTNLPPNMTFSEGVTLPAVFSTAVYCLFDIAKMKKGDTVLIHTASGGVGLCAIQLAQMIGANIIATAGSTRKRSYLHNLGIKHVFHSRTTDFGKQILEVTNGRGVDIVLNSITGPGFKEASLEALSKNGRFIEMSKMSVWKEEEVKELRPDVFYCLVDLTQLERTEYEKLSCTLKHYLETQSIKPIPFERFDALNIRGALNYLQKAKHFGKIVCVMPEVKVGKSKLTVTTPLFSSESTYIVTGGLGGIGLEVVKWMLENGANHVAIASRSPPKPEVVQLVEMWTNNGKHVEAFEVDVGNYEQCKKLLEDLQNSNGRFPPVRGVMHAAGVLQDATLENMNWEKFQFTYNPKVIGSWNLHDLTKDLHLEHFVLFSSLASAFGTPGQTNHSGSNSFEDTLAHYRKSIGLPAISVNWGNWGEVGVATEVDLPGLRPISTCQGLLALETFLKTQKSHLVVLNVDSFAMLAKLMPRVKTYVDDKRLFGETKSLTVLNSDEFWVQYDASDGREEKLEVFKKFIKSTVRITLKMADDEAIDDHVEFQVLGIDSLMMLEMKNALQNVLGSRMTISAAKIKDCNNTLALANRLVEMFEGENEMNVPTEEELKALVREDSVLPENINLSENLADAKPIPEIETVLLTGVTGNLGPYFLRDLSQRAQIKKIYCLIRTHGKVTPFQRLEARLGKTSLLNEVNMEKVECIQGDITHARLGLTEEQYSKLANEVDAICHSAVRADHTAKYWKAPLSNKNTVRTVNVFGTVNILEFATTSKLKSVCYASTLLTVPTLDEDGCISEEWEDVGAFDHVLKLNMGYPLSKHIAEQLMKEALRRGVPVKVLRLPGIAGDSRTGRHDFESNHMVLRWLGYMKLGCMPDHPVPLPLLPVDHCVRLSLDIFFNSNADWDVYNVSTRGNKLEQDIMGIAPLFKISIDPVPYSEFVERLKCEDDKSPLAPFKTFYEDEVTDLYEDFVVGTDSFTFGLKFVENSYDFYRSRKLQKLFPNYENGLEQNDVIMKRDLQYLKESGVFKKFGITE